MKKIAAGATETLVFEVTPRAAGPFAGQVHLFVADPYTREIIVTIQGEAREKGKKAS